MKVKVRQPSRRLRSIRNATISTIVILAILIGGGLTYTWWMGQQEVPVQAKVEDTSIKRAQIKPRQVDPNAPIGVANQMLTSPIRPGENASLTVRTTPQAICNIAVIYGQPSETDKRSLDSGLVEKRADDYGVVTWSWRVEPNRPVGVWPVEVTCGNDSKSGFLRLDFELSYDEES